jgi:hypothetical protein
LLAVRINGQWLVADYQRNGRSVRESIVPGIRGSQSKAGLRLEVLGLYMPDGAGDLWVRVTNARGDHQVRANVRPLFEDTQTGDRIDFDLRVTIPGFPV